MKKIVLFAVFVLATTTAYAVDLVERGDGRKTAKVFYDGLDKNFSELSGKTRVSIIDYGAIPDDSIDDSVAIQSAIDSAAGREVYIPRGKYIASNVIVKDPGGLKITGDSGGQYIGSIICNPTSGPTFTFGSESSTSHQGYALRDFTLLGSNIDGAIGMKILRVNNNFIENVSIVDFNGVGGIGLLVDGTGDASITNTIIGLKVRGCKTGVKLISTTSTRFVSGYFNAVNGDVGIELGENSDTLALFGVAFDGWQSAAVVLYGQGSSVVGCRFEGNVIGVDVNPSCTSASITASFFNLKGQHIGVQAQTGSRGTILKGNMFEDIVSGQEVAGDGALVND